MVVSTERFRWRIVPCSRWRQPVISLKYSQLWWQHHWRAGGRFGDAYHSGGVYSVLVAIMLENIQLLRSRNSFSWQWAPVWPPVPLFRFLIWADDSSAHGEQDLPTQRFLAYTVHSAGTSFVGCETSRAWMRGRTGYFNSCENKRLHYLEISGLDSSECWLLWVLFWQIGLKYSLKGFITAYMLHTLTEW